MRVKNIILYLLNHLSFLALQQPSWTIETSRHRQKPSHKNTSAIWSTDHISFQCSVMGKEPVILFPSSDLIQQFVNTHNICSETEVCCKNPSKTCFYCRFCFKKTCDRCFDGHCEQCVEKLNFVSRFTDLRGKKIDSYPECCKVNHGWPPLFITTAWVFTLKSPSESLMDMGYMFHDIPESMFLSLYLQYHYNMTIFQFEESHKQHCFDLTLWISLFKANTSTSLTDMLQSVKPFQLFCDTETVYQGSLMAIKEPYKRCLWTSTFVYSMFEGTLLKSIITNFKSILNDEVIEDFQSPLVSQTKKDKLFVCEENVDQHSSLPGINNDTLSDIPSQLPSQLFGNISISDIEMEIAEQQSKHTVWNLIHVLIIYRTHCFTNPDNQSIIDELIRSNVLNEHNMNIVLFRSVIKLIARAENILTENLDEVANNLAIYHITTI